MTGLSLEDRLRWVSAHSAQLEEDIAKERAEVIRLRQENLKLLADTVIVPLPDEALRAQLQRTLVVMSRVGKMLSKHAPAADEREAFAEFFSLLAEHGCHPGQAEQERLELHFAEWEARRR